MNKNDKEKLSKVFPENSCFVCFREDCRKWQEERTKGNFGDDCYCLEAFIKKEKNEIIDKNK